MPTFKDFYFNSSTGKNKIHARMCVPDTCTLYAYCLMSNHVHLLYRQGTEEVDQSMKRLESSD